MAEPECGPLVLGSGGRVGRLLRRLAAMGLWPGAEPIWHTRDGREGTWGWDLAPGGRAERAAPRGVSGVVALAGATAGADEAALIRANAGPAIEAVHLGRALGVPVLLCSSAAVYGREDAPPGGHAEDGEARPASAYGRAKLAMERAVEEALDGSVACLRIGNVAGADALFGAMASGPVTLDRLADGAAPRRAYVGPLTLARALVSLLAAPSLPPVLNLAQPGLVGMDAVLRAACVPFGWRDNPSALPALGMDLARLHALAPLPPATAETLVAEARLAGWRPFGEAA